MNPCFRLKSLAIALPLGGIANAARLPEPGEASAAVVSPQMEQALGAQSMQSLRANGGWLDDPEVNTYLANLGRRLIRADPDTARESFEFFAVASRELDAFALPGGYVGVDTGLILATQSESELALKSSDGDKREQLIVESRPDTLRAQQKEVQQGNGPSPKHAEIFSLPAFTGR